MKKILAVFLSLGIGLLLVSAVLAGTNSISLQETNLTPKPAGEAYEVNFGSDGYLYLSDYTAMQIWRVDPANPQVDKYQFAINVSDARPDSSGKIWFTDGDTTFARLDPTSNQAVYWDVPEGRYLQGLTFDNSGKLWMTEYFSSISEIYRFDTSTTELCTYTLPLDGSSQSYYILSEQNQLWFANRGLQRIYRLNSSTDQATWWQITDANSRPSGIALDTQGNLWWADEGLGALAKLNPATNIMTRYNLPDPAQPQMIVLHNDVVWYTAAAAGGVGYFGALHPQQVGGTPVELDRQTYPSQKECHSNWGAGKSLFVPHTTTTPSWSPADLTTLATPSGWKVFQLPANAHPYGITIANGELWMSDQGRQKLMQIPFSDLLGKNIFLPMVVR